MKIKFENSLEHQLEAIEAIVGIFQGQEICKTTFTVEKNIRQMRLGTVENELGIGNKLLLFPEEIQENLNSIQTKNGLPITKKLSQKDYNFSVEMETGTGKTYVYLRTILEMNKRYGFTKFIIVVPSIAIKEGVKKSLEITKEHFKELYDNIIYDYFVYESKKIDQIRNFAVNDCIQIMVINIDAFNKDTNIINIERDQANGYRPIDYIQQCSPIVIIDEPQNMESERAKEALKNLNPLCTLRYSATHKEKYNSVYKLDSIDAYEKQLVKQIEVATVGVTDSNNTEYIKLNSVKTNKNGISAKLELDIKSGKAVVRKEVVVKKGDILSEKAKRDIYDGYIVNDIYCELGNEWIDLVKVNLKLGQVNGGQDPILIKRLQIRKTIQEHFEKQKRLRPLGIKVLSLFFIDKVSNYRVYDEDGKAQLGNYAEIFEEEYIDIIEKNPEYNKLSDSSMPLFQRASKAHDGYFSIDKKKNKSGKDVEFYKDTKGTTDADNDTFNKIMRDKEKLLSFSEPLSFIFSHSALKEGWDNPNVFQICTLNETTSEMKKRQEIGRGLRIAVNQHGERVRGFEVNTLTVMANESYDNFVTSLQSEMEKDEGIKFGYIEDHIFSNIVIKVKTHDEAGKEYTKEDYLGHSKSKEIFKALVEYGYVEISGKATDKLKKDLLEKEVEIPTEFSDIKEKIVEKLKSSSGRLIIRNADEKVKVEINKNIYLGEDFRELWNKVKYKTTYSVDFNEEKLINECSKILSESVYIPFQKVLFTKTRLEITKGGILEGKELQIEDSLNGEQYKENFQLPDIISYLQNETNLTRKTIVDILIKSKTLNSFKKDPQKYLEQVSELIKRTMQSFIVDGIRYEKIGENEYYCQELFETEDLFGYLKTAQDKKSNMIESKKSPYSHIIFDSETIENPFAQEMEKSQNVKVYAKLPNWFKIETPLGNYNPDWAVLISSTGDSNGEKLYFVVETKGSIFSGDLRGNEKAKIDCGKSHFRALETGVSFELADNFDKLKSKF